MQELFPLLFTWSSPNPGVLIGDVLSVELVLGPTV
jgi:hypothetical protein